MDEIYRMLGKLHEADLEREADLRRRAAAIPAGGQSLPARLRRRFKASFERLRTRVGTSAGDYPRVGA